MMKKTKYILKGFLMLAMVFMFTQCADNKNANEGNATPAAALASGELKIAYVEIDSLLTKYRFWNDLNEMMIQKEENIRTTLNEKAKELEQEMREFQRKLENNGFASRERAEQENLRIAQKQRDLQQLQEKLANELQTENQKNSLQLRDSINSFLKIYNKDKGYSLIFSNTGFDNLLYADKAFNITEEIVEGLNARYTPSAAVKK
jgi:outer membrane protein